MPLFLSRRSYRRNDNDGSRDSVTSRRSFSNNKLRPVASFLLLPSLKKRERSFNKNASRKSSSSFLSKRYETESVRTVQTEDVTEGPSTLEIGNCDEEQDMEDDLSSTDLRLGGLQVLRRSAYRPNPLRSILKVKTLRQSLRSIMLFSTAEESSSSGGCERATARRRVSFEEHAQIHHHTLALGDHPSANLDGPPLTLEWQSCCDEIVSLNLSMPERQQVEKEASTTAAATAAATTRSGRQQSVRRRPGAERKQILLDLGFKKRDLRKARNAARKIQESREDIIYEEQERLEMALLQQLYQEGSGEEQFEASQIHEF